MNRNDAFLELDILNVQQN